MIGVVLSVRLPLSSLSSFPGSFDAKLNLFSLVVLDSQVRAQEDVISVWTEKAASDGGAKLKCVSRSSLFPPPRLDSSSSADKLFLSPFVLVFPRVTGRPSSVCSTSLRRPLGSTSSTRSESPSRPPSPRLPPSPPPISSPLPRSLEAPKLTPPFVLDFVLCLNQPPSNDDHPLPTPFRTRSEQRK